MREENRDEKEKFLGRSFIFKALDDRTKRELAAFAHTRRFKSGDIIFSMGAPGQSMMAIAEGTVRISMLAPTARDVVLTELTTGDVFGEIALLDGGERSAEARALTNCTLIVLDRRSLLEVLHRNPELATRLIELLCARLRRSDERMMEIAFLDLPSRMAKTLLRATAGDRDGASRPLTKLSLSQAELANMIGSSRENVNRCLRKWQRGNLVDLKDGWLIILDRNGLEALAEMD
jgi:CRP/FNR family transcriptional regulator, cyclic AMP receptor protein